MQNSVRFGHACTSPDKRGRGLDHLLQVVEEEEHLPIGDVLGETVLRAERLRDLLRDERCLTERGEPDPEDPCLVGGDERRCGLNRETGLAGSAWSGKG